MDYYDIEHSMDWFREVIKSAHPTKEAMLAFLYSCEWPYQVELDIIEFVEGVKAVDGIEAMPVAIYNMLPKMWWKALYAISLTIEEKASGKIIHYYPNGVYKFEYREVNGMMDKVLVVVTPPTPMMVFTYVKGCYVRK